MRAAVWRAAMRGRALACGALPTLLPNQGTRAGWGNWGGVVLAYCNVELRECANLSPVLRARAP